MTRFRAAARPDLADRRVTSTWQVDMARAELLVRAPSLEQAFAKAALAFAALHVVDGGGQPDRVPVVLRTPSLAELLGAFLGDVAHLVSIERFLPETVERLDVRGTTLRAVLIGIAIPDPEQAAAVLVEHAAVGPDSRGWSARVGVNAAAAPPPSRDRS